MAWPCEVPPAAILSQALDAPTDHVFPAKAYLARLRPHLSAFGISRVADITGLDVIGFPVVQVVRPMARSNAVTQGKAASLEAAAVGAVLECLEMAAGEEPDRFDTRPDGQADPWRPLAPGAVWPDDQTRYVAGWNLTEDRAAQIPLDVIATDFNMGADAEAAPILRSSIGLGAGATVAAALMHGMLEAIEGDARLRATPAGLGRPVALSASDPIYGPLLGQIHRAGLRPRVDDLSRNGTVIVQASVMERPDASALPLPAVGYAARACPSQAIAAALAEAVQARLAVISGAREDITQRFYQCQVPPEDLRAAWDDHAPVDRGVTLPTAAPLSLRDLARAVGPVYAVALLHAPDIPLAITRVLAPGLIADPLRLEVAP